MQEIEKYLKVSFIAKIKQAPPASLLEKLRQAAGAMPGFLGMTSMEMDGIEQTDSYWENEQAMKQWSAWPDHVEAKKNWGDYYFWTRISREWVDRLPEF